jgi:hypothetical protein
MNFELTSASTFYVLIFLSVISLLSVALFWQKIFRKRHWKFYTEIFFIDSSPNPAHCKYWGWS